MIELLDETFCPEVYGKKDIFSVKIFSLFRAYGTKYPFIRFYAQKNNIEVTAVICILDNDITVSYIQNKADIEELTEFVNVMGFSTLLCDDDFVLAREYDSGIVMSSERKTEIACDYTDVDEYPYLFDLFNFVDYGNVDFESWYVDISHRIRHGCAKAVTLNVDSEIISSAIFSSIYENDAILTAVQTKPEFRKSGYASALVSAMCCDVTGTVFLMREKDKNESFYKKLLFDNIGKWRIYK